MVDALNKNKSNTNQLSSSMEVIFIITDTLKNGIVYALQYQDIGVHHKFWMSKLGQQLWIRVFP